ncbi:amidase [Nakamurella flavida]|uniref:Amidase n=1 Tax=Nakamurella flavida TaxID=363630 RepID=A0A939C1T3_9ACTN|nr:amidase [Nakamurella flavida]MBM9478018.1 amidase [Nakamurella flavida]MDP9778265.1 amidase [Nakamurella flavida]
MGDELHHRSATTLARMIRTREVSAREVVQAHLDRIAATNPQVNAIVTLTAESALARAAAQDELAARGEFAGPLHGLPVAHKDNHLTAGVRTTFGSRSRADFVPHVDDLVIERMKAAGVITLGKTNVPEFVAGGHTYNEVFGVTRNPYDLSVTAGGSSGGAAAALAAGMHPLADGNDFGGSLRLPAGYCNVVALRPTPGRVPQWPAADGFVGLSVQGPMARSVDDTALLLSVLAGPDRRSPSSLETPGAGFATVHAADLSRVRVAFSPDLGGLVPVEDEIVQIVRSAAHRFAEAGAVVDEACPDLTEADECFRVLRAWQFEAGLGAVLDEHRELVKPSLYENMLAGRVLTGPQVGRAAVLRTTLYHRLREFLEPDGGGWDVLVLPTAPLRAFDAGIEYPDTVRGEHQGDYLGWMQLVYALSVTGHPVLAMPAGFTAAGTPVGIQIVGRHRGEADLLAVGKAFEAITGYAGMRPVLPGVE